MTGPTPESVELGFKRIKGMTLEKAAKVQKAAFFDIAKRIIMMTPVDTGRACGGWHADVNQFTAGPKDFQGDRNSAINKAMASVAAAIAKHKIGDWLSLANPVHYIRYLDKGTSKQAPAGMTTQAIAAWEGVVTRINAGVK